MKHFDITLVRDANMAKIVIAFNNKLIERNTEFKKRLTTLEAKSYVDDVNDRLTAENVLLKMKFYSCFLA